MTDAIHPIDQTGDRTVYVRPVAVDSLPDEVKARAAGMKTLYAVHDAAGAPLALVPKRSLAFVLARQHDFTPVSVH